MVLKWKQLLYLIGPTILLFVVLLALSEAKPTFAQDDSTCISCHSDKTRLESLGKRGIQVYVDPEQFRAESHGGLDCITCHAGDPTKDIPEEACIGIAYKDPADPEVLDQTCGSCHPEIASRHVTSIHFRPQWHPALLARLHR